MLLVLASEFDAAARAALARWSACGLDVDLVTPRHLSQPGWTLARGAAVSCAIGTRVVHASRIDGVLVRLPCIPSAELQHIDVADRAYVAAEMTAFLMAWLTSLRCAVRNKPMPPSLAGPAWRSEQWLACADRADLPVRSGERRGRDNGPPYPEDTVAVTVIHGRPVGMPDSCLAERAKRLAHAADVDLLQVSFDSDGAIVDTSIWPDLGDEHIADAVLEAW